MTDHAFHFTTACSVELSIDCDLRFVFSGGHLLIEHGNNTVFETEKMDVENAKDVLEAWSDIIMDLRGAL